MGKPRMIIVIRHAQSEGNQNRQIHQTIPDHRVKLTSDGWTQAHDAGLRLRSMLRPDDTLQIYTSPYRRTRETTEGILRSLTSDDPTPSPFRRQAIKVYEEPRLREQDFGNFQPCSAAMERMWQERADYGHFFYRIPNGESAADAYDRVSGFNETLWRSFSEEDFPSVCVLVTHGLMSRVFLMKWYHWSVEYFEDLRNVNHCEFVVMKRPADSGKFILQNELRTWSELKRRAAAERGEDTSSSGTSAKSLAVPEKRPWGGCPDGCDHQHDGYPTRARRRNTETNNESNPKSPKKEERPNASEKADNNDSATPLEARPPSPNMRRDNSTPSQQRPQSIDEEEEAFPNPGSAAPKDARTSSLNLNDGPTDNDRNEDKPRNIHSNTADAFSARLAIAQRPRQIPSYIEAGRDFGGTFSGAATPMDTGTPTGASHTRGPSGEYGFPSQDLNSLRNPGGSRLRDRGGRDPPGYKPNQEEHGRWINESGMGSGARADALGDQLDEEEEDDIVDGTEVGRGQAGEAVTGMEDLGKKEAGVEVIERMESRDKSLRSSVY